MLASKYSENHDLKVEQIKMAKKKGNGGVKITETSNFGANILKIGWKLWLLWFFTFFFLRYFEIINKFQHDSPLKCYSNGPYKTKFIKIHFDSYLSVNLDKLDVFRLGRPYILYTEYIKLFNNVDPAPRFWLLQGSSLKHL